MDGIKSRKTKTMKQRKLNKIFRRSIVISLVIIFITMMFVLVVEASRKNEIEDKENTIKHESEINDHETITLSANASSEEIKAEEKVNTFSRNLSKEDKYLLAKITMAEAEGESLNGKILVILVILNRVKSSQFPNTIKEVIFQEKNGVYQFSPIGDGRWSKVEPNEECWKAVEIVNSTEEDMSNGALYFESCSGESWHSRNLQLVYKFENTRFYK